MIRFIDLKTQYAALKPDTKTRLVARAVSLRAF